MLTLFVVTAVLYGFACVLFLADLASEWDRAGIVARHILVAAAVTHVTYLGFSWWSDPGPIFGTIYQTLAWASLLVVLLYGLALFRYRATILGGFVVPVVLLFFVGAGLGMTTGPVPADVRSALLPIHIGVNVLGVVCIGLAFSVAAAYLLQERLLRQKQVGGLFQRLPALDRLDKLAHGLVGAGFVLLTGGLVSGVFWAVRQDPSWPGLSATQSLAIVSWLVFGAVLVLRRVAGWRGRRAALGTAVGFALTTAVLAGYLLRAGSVG